MYKKTLALVAAVSLYTVPALAESQVYFCNFEAHRNKGWVPEQAYYEIDLDNQAALVSDGFIYAVNDKKGLKPEFKRPSAKRVEMKYKLNNLTGTFPDGETIKTSVTYIVTVNISNLKAKIRTRIHSAGGYDGNTASGPCSIVKV